MACIFVYVDIFVYKYIYIMNYHLNLILKYIRYTYHLNIIYVFLSIILLVVDI